MVTATGVSLQGDIISLACLASQGDAEGLCAEDCLPCKGQQGGIDGYGQLHGQLRGDDAGDNHGTIQQQLEAVAIRILHPSKRPLRCFAVLWHKCNVMLATCIHFVWGCDLLARVSMHATIRCTLMWWEGMLPAVHSKGRRRQQPQQR